MSEFEAAGLVSQDVEYQGAAPLTQYQLAQNTFNQFQNANQAAQQGLNNILQQGQQAQAQNPGGQPQAPQAGPPGNPIRPF